MPSNQEQLVIEVIDKAVSNLKNIRRELDQTDQGLSNVSKSAAKTSQSFLDVAKGVGLFAVARRAVQEITQVFKDSVREATQYEMSMRGLGSVANYFKITQDEAKASAESLSSDGLMTVADSANSLKQLLSSGLNMEQAQKLMEAYKNEAAFGRVNTISYTQAVGNLAESFKTENSMIGNLSGQTENYSYILDVGAAKLGKKTAALTSTERIQAKYLGTLAVAAKNEGNAAQMADTFAGAQARLTVAIQNQEIAFGENVQYGLTPFYNAMTSILTPTDQAGDAADTASQKVGFLGTSFYVVGQAASGFAFTVKGVIDLLSGFVSAVGIGASAFADTFKTAFGNVGKLFENFGGKLSDLAAGAVSFFKADWDGVKRSIGDAWDGSVFANFESFDWQASQAQIDGLSGKMQSFTNDILGGGDAFGKMFDAVFHGAPLMNKTIEDNLGEGALPDFGAGDEEKAKKYSDVFKNIADQASRFLKKFRDNADQIRKDFDETIDAINKKRRDLNKSFTSDVANAVLDIRNQIKTLNESISSTNEDYAGQMASSVITAQDKLSELQASLAEQQSLGSLDQDQSYMETLQSQIADQEAFLEKHADVVSDVQAQIDEQRRVSGLDEIEKLQEEHDVKVAAIQTQVDEEQAILDAHSKWIQNHQDAIVEAARKASLDQIQILREQMVAQRDILDKEEKKAKKDKKSAKKENRGELRENFKELIKQFIEDTQSLSERTSGGTIPGQAVADIIEAENAVNKVGKRAGGKTNKGNVYNITLNVKSGESISSILSQLTAKMKTI